MSSVPSPSSRFAFIDWTRGLAAIIMLQGHVFHSFTRPDLREGGPFVLSQFVGGMPPAVFLFLTGMTLAFLMDSQERKGRPRIDRVLTSMQRAGYLFVLAFLFRLQLWIFGLPNSPWTDLFRVDILNCMGFSIAVLSLMAVFRTAQRVRICAVAGVIIAGTAPLVSMLDWSGVATPLRHYIAPDYQFFSFFPWAAFLAFGMSAGSILKSLEQDHLDRAMQWTALVGLGLILTGQYASDIPYSIYGRADFWLNSPWLVYIKLGVVLLMLSGAYLWTRHGAKPGWSWVRQFGTTSLLVYWVHTEIVYGRWLYFWKESLTAGQAAVVAVGVVLLMLALSTLRTNWNQWKDRLRSGFGLFEPPFVPGRVPGD